MDGPGLLEMFLRTPPMPQITCSLQAIMQEVCFLHSTLHEIPKAHSAQAQQIQEILGKLDLLESMIRNYQEAFCELQGRLVDVEHARLLKEMSPEELERARQEEAMEREMIEHGEFSLSVFEDQEEASIPASPIRIENASEHKTRTPTSPKRTANVLGIPFRF